MAPTQTDAHLTTEILHVDPTMKIPVSATSVLEAVVWEAHKVHSFRRDGQSVDFEVCPELACRRMRELEREYMP